MGNYYQVLGVSQWASKLEVKRAFREKAKFYHPDRNFDVNAKGHFQKINEAYQVLINERKRGLYDLKLRRIRAYRTLNQNYHNVAPRVFSYRYRAQRSYSQRSGESSKFERFTDLILFLSLLLAGVYSLFYGLFRLLISPNPEIKPYPAIVLGVVFSSLMIYTWWKKTKLLGQ